MKKKLAVLFLAVFVVLFKLGTVWAGTGDSTLKRVYVPNVWSFHYRNGKVWTYGQLNYKYINGKLGYCIEPDSAVNTDIYNSTTDWSVSKYTEEQKKLMELYSYYGFGANHINEKYYMAAQELIWEFSDDEKIIWTKEDHSDSEQIDVGPFKREILRLVNNHNKAPSFANKTYYATIGDTLNLTDNNWVLTDREIISNSEYKKAGYSITVPIKDRNTINMSFKSIGSNYDSTIVYYADIRSQRVATFNKPLDNTSYLTIIPDKTRVVINKKDLETKENILADGNVIKIKNVDTNEYVKVDDNDEFLIDNTGKFTIDLKDGSYEIEEINASNGYYVNNENVSFTINKDIKLNENYEYNIDFYNSKVYGQISIKKTNNKKDNLVGCKFEIYDENMNLVDTIVTTNHEYDDSILLPLGKYYVKEVKTINGYILDDKLYEVNLEYKDDKTIIVKEKLDVVNEKIKCEVLLVDTTNDGEIIEGVDISIYNSNDEFIYKGTTNNEGKILISPISYGDYYIVQDKVPNGYELNKEKVEFSISDDSCMSSIKLTNNKVNMPKTNTSNMDVISIIVFIINLGIIKLVKKVN